MAQHELRLNLSINAPVDPSDAFALANRIRSIMDVVTAMMASPPMAGAGYDVKSKIVRTKKGRESGPDLMDCVSLNPASLETVEINIPGGVAFTSMSHPGSQATTVNAAGEQVDQETEAAMRHGFTPKVYPWNDGKGNAYPCDTEPRDPNLDIPKFLQRP